MLQKSGKYFVQAVTQKNSNITLFLWKYIRALSRRAEEDFALTVIGLDGPCVVDKVECRKPPAVNCTHKSLQRDHPQGW